MDYYIQQSKNHGYVSKGLGKFEKDLLDHVRKIRDGSVLLNPDKGAYTGEGDLDKQRFEAVFNQKVKAHFKVDQKSEQEALQLF